MSTRFLFLLPSILFFSLYSAESAPASNNAAIPYAKLYESVVPTPVRNTPNTFGRKFTWTFKGNEYSLVVDVSIEEYNACQGYAHAKSEYVAMVKRGREHLQPVISQFRVYIERQKWSKPDIVNFVLSFAQSLPYRTDAASLNKSDYPRDAIQTLVDVGNDCEDSSILLASILSGLGFEVALLHPEGHIAVGVAGDFSGTYLSHKGRRFFYCETTGTGWELGNIPAEYKDQKIELYLVRPANAPPIVGRPTRTTKDVTPPEWIPSLKEIYLVVDKSRHELSLFNANKVLKVFTVDTGREPGPKRERGDKRTPEGRYKIVDIRKPDDSYVYGSYFMEINYPNYEDWKKNRTGSGIGIHGTNRRMVVGEDVTDGCIVMNNEDLEEITRFVSKGTPVFIYASLPERITVTSIPEPVRRFGNFIYGPLIVGEPVPITVRFPDIEEYDAIRGKIVFAFREEDFDVPTDSKQKAKIYWLRGFSIVELTNENWMKAGERVFTIYVIPKKAGKIEYFVRLVLRATWGFITYPQYGWLDPTGLPAISPTITIQAGD